MKILLLFSLLILASMVHAEIYKWTDKQGNVHFGDRPTSNVEKQVVDIYVGTDAVVNKQRRISKNQPNDQTQDNRLQQAKTSSDVRTNCSAAFDKMKSFMPQWLRLLNGANQSSSHPGDKLGMAFKGLEEFASVTKNQFMESCFQEYSSIGKTLTTCLANARDALSSANCMALNLANN